MVDYRRMKNMVLSVENTTSTTSMHHLRDLWKSPRGTVLRIQVAAIVAIISTFFLIAFGSCRRWSNRWIVQKGFIAAQALHLPLAAYSIGIMQSSSVKSEMYPIWTVSLFTLFGSIDPVTSYNGLNYKGPFSKMVYGISLYCGYVVIMTIPTISSVAGNMAIGMLSAITFIKGFHRSLALMQQRRMRNYVQTVLDVQGHAYVLENDRKKRKIERDSMIVSFATDIHQWKPAGRVSLSDIEDALDANEQDKRLHSCYELCLAMSLSHNLQRHFLGLGYRETDPGNLKNIKYEWALKVIEIELALVYDVFFTGNPFLHYYQAKNASLWALASFIGICYVGVAAAVPGTMSSRHSASGPGDCTNVVGTTTGDLVVTFIIMVSLALLQLMHLIRCWTSNWARVAVACAYALQQRMEFRSGGQYKTPYWRAWWMRLQAYVANSSNWFDKYLWQEKIGQYSVLPEGRLVWGKKGEGGSRIECKTLFSRLTSLVGQLYQKCSHRMVKMLGLDYMEEVLRDWNLLGSENNKRTTVRLNDDVKGYIIDFLRQIETNIVDDTWLFVGEKDHIAISLPLDAIGKDKDIHRILDDGWNNNSHGYKYSECVMKWHIATWYCELAEQRLEKQDALSNVCGETGISFFKKAAAAIITGCLKKEANGEGEAREENRNRLVANALSKYCAYLMLSAPELLPGPALDTKRVHDNHAKAARSVLDRGKEILLGALSDPAIWTGLVPSLESKKWGELASRPRDDSTSPHYFKFERNAEQRRVDSNIWEGFLLAKQVLGNDPPLKSPSDPWELLALVWVRIFVWAVPYGNVDAHMQHLQLGGEFITHLWALLYHLDIREWKLAEKRHSTSTSSTKLPDSTKLLDDPQINTITNDDAKRILDEVSSYSSAPYPTEDRTSEIEEEKSHSSRFS